MAISLLHPDTARPVPTPNKPKILYHLSLDRSFSHICADIKRRDAFLAVIAATTDSPAEMIYRQQILEEFRLRPTLLDGLISLSARFAALKQEQKRAAKEMFALQTTRASSVPAAKNLLQTQALCLERALLFVRAFAELLDEHNVTSPGLRSFADACREVCTPPAFAELLSFCRKYEDISVNRFLDFKLVLNCEGKIDEYAMIDHRHIRITDPEQRKKSLPFFTKVQEKQYPCVRFCPPNGEFCDNLTVSALTTLTKYFSSISEQIFDRFPSLCTELDFYDVALKYVNILIKKCVPYVFPTVSADGTAQIDGLYDLYLLMTEPTPADIVPNDFILPASGGLAVFGENGSGKTVYLRAIGTAQLLAQAGLPIPCTRAQITLFTQIATQFSEAEKDFCAASEAGRFEQEVRELANMVENLCEGGLVLLNETFQSTAYAEGAEGLYHLLEHFSACGIRWVLVTHLRRLEAILAPSDAARLYAGPDHRIR